MLRSGARRYDPRPVIAERRRNRHIAWLLLFVLAALIAYGGVAVAQPYCNCVPWYELLLPPTPGLALIVVIALGLATLGVVGALGVLPRAQLGGSKIKWSLGVSAFVWIPVVIIGSGLLLSQKSGAPNPFLSNREVGLVLLIAAITGFVVSSFVLWLVAYLGDVVRHGISGRPMK